MTEDVAGAVKQIETLATQIPNSNSFASASLAREILQHARRVHSVRIPQAKPVQIPVAQTAGVSPSSQLSSTEMPGGGTAASPSDGGPVSLDDSAVFESFYRTSAPETPPGTGLGVGVMQNMLRNLSAFESLEHLRVLLVDEDATTRHVLRTALSKAGYQIGEAASGIEATRLLHDQPSPDLILVDVNKATSEGAELLASLRNAAPAIPIVSVSPTARPSGVPTTPDPQSSLVAHAIHQQLREALREMTANPLEASSVKAE